MAGIARRSALLAGAASLLPRAAPAAGPDVPALLERVFRPLLAEHGIPGLAVAVTAARRRHLAGFGVASRSGGEPVDERTIFEIGSISKTFTATFGGLQLARGALRLDDPPGRYLPRLRGAPVDAATLLHLGTYTAGGLPLQFPPQVREPDMLDYFRAWRPAAPPGRMRRYSNPSIGLFGHIAAVASGGGFAERLQADLIAPLGLEHTGLRVPPQAMRRYAWGHDTAGRPVRVSRGVLDAPAYGVKSTAADLLRFVEANLQPQLLAPPLRQAVAATQRGHFRAGALVQGLGWEQYAAPASLDALLAGNAATMARDAHPATAIVPPVPAAPGTWFCKTGSTNGFGALALFVPSARAGMVLLANRNFPIEARIRAGWAVLQALL